MKRHSQMEFSGTIFLFFKCLVPTALDFHLVQSLLILDVVVYFLPSSLSLCINIYISLTLDLFPSTVPVTGKFSSPSFFTTFPKDFICFFFAIAINPGSVPVICKISVFDSITGTIILKSDQI